MIVYDQNRQPISLGDLKYEGGEGWIYAIPSQPGKVAKIYKPQRQVGRETKLRWMIANPPVDPGRKIRHSSIAWPDMIFCDASQGFAGYRMPEITNTCKLLNVINPRLRAKTFASFDRVRLHRVAYNLATAIAALHACDYVLGDLNESNILVTPGALITVVDTDSFQVREQQEGKISFYPCPVGRPEFTPPELQGHSFSDEVRQPEQDAFALAVLIFQILVEGSHPFRALWLGPGDPPPIEERIARGLFPHTGTPSRLVAPPPSVGLSGLHPPLADLFLRCFADGHHGPKRRPTAMEWATGLNEAERFLLQCPNGHAYGGHLPECPVCGAKKKPIYTAMQPARPTTSSNPSSQVTAPVNVPPPNPPQPANQLPPQNPPLPANPAPGTCPSCQNILSLGDLYCPACSAPINPRTCRSCGFEQVPGMAKCCPRCGK